MLPVTDSFEFDYFGSDIVYGRGCLSKLEAYLEKAGCDTALIVCGSNVGANDDVIDPLKAGLGDRFGGVFDGTTPAKTIGSVYDGIDRMNDVGADILIGVGGGSSIDIARFMAAVDADGRSLETYRREAKADELAWTAPTEASVPVIAIPTTFAGADISNGGSVEILPAAESPTGFPVRLSGTTMPIGMFYDPELFEATPMGALAGSAMNGFNKGLETLYVPEPNPISDSAAVHGLRLMTEAFPKLQDGDSGAMDRAVIGTILVQFKRQTSIIHAYGHGFSRRYPIQQGVIHGIMAPHVLRYLFSRVDARRELLATGLNIDTTELSDEAVGESIVAAVTAVRDSFDIPVRLGELEPVETADFPDIAAFLPTDGAMARAPPGLEATEAELEAVLHNAW